MPETLDRTGSFLGSTGSFSAVTNSQQRDDPDECPGLLDSRLLTLRRSVQVDCPCKPVFKPNQVRLPTPRTSDKPVNTHGAECNYYGAQRPGAALAKLCDTWSASRLPEMTCSHCM